MRSVARFQAVWCAQYFLRDLVLIYPVYAIMMGDAGITPLQLSILFMAWSGSVILLEVPTGTLADVLPRKHTMVVSAAVKGLSFPVWLFVPTFWGFLAGFLIWGLGSSLASGTRESLVHDTLVELGHPEQFTKVFGRGRAAEYLGATVALAAGGVLAESGYTLPLALSALAPWGAAATILFFLDEPPRSGDPEPSRRYTEVLWSGLREARASAVLVRIIVMFGTVFAFSSTLDEYVGPLLDEKGVRLAAVGFVYAAIMTASTIGVALAHRLPAGSPRSISGLLVVATVILLASLTADGVVAAVGLSVYFAACAAAETLAQAHLQHAIRGRARATITSIAGMAQEGGGVVVYLLVGIAAQFTEWQRGVALVAALSLVGCCVFVFGFPRREPRS